MGFNETVKVPPGMKELLMYCFPRIAGSSILSKFVSVSKTSRVLVAGIVPMGSLGGQRNLVFVLAVLYSHFHPISVL